VFDVLADCKVSESSNKSHILKSISCVAVLVSL
jgi:hypothetical protein